MTGSGEDGYTGYNTNKVASEISAMPLKGKIPHGHPYKGDFGIDRLSLFMPLCAKDPTQDPGSHSSHHLEMLLVSVPCAYKKEECIWIGLAFKKPQHV